MQVVPAVDCQGDRSRGDVPSDAFRARRGGQTFFEVVEAGWVDERADERRKVEVRNLRLVTGGRDGLDSLGEDVDNRDSRVFIELEEESQHSRRV